MNIIKIKVPDFNDSFSRVVLDSTQYQIRFTWNETAKRWSFGLYTMQKEPIIVGIRLVPYFPLNLQLVDERLPQGVFGVYSDNETIERNDFINGRAIFAYVSQKEIRK